MVVNVYRVVLAASLAVVFGCGDTAPESSLPGEVVRSSMRRRAPSEELGDVRALARNDADFAFELLRELPSDENLFFAPHSISTALAMTYAGAAGSTAREMREALHFAQEPEVLHQAFNTLDQLLASRGEGQPDTDGEPFRLSVVDGLFAQRGFPLRDRYLDDLARWYGAEVALLDFAADPESARGAINAWAAEATEGRVEELLSARAVGPSTRFVAVDALTFRAAWKHRFSERATMDRPFTRLDGSTVSVPTMWGESAVGFAEGAGWRATRIPYVGDAVSLLAVVPDDLAAFEEELDAERIEHIAGQVERGFVYVALPRFAIRSRLELEDALRGLGMREAFDDADFSSLSSDERLALGGVVHEAFVRVDEEGTEAVGATASTGTSISVSPTLRIDRPFLFFIPDQETGAVLFVGRVVDPSA